MPRRFERRRTTNHCGCSSPFVDGPRSLGLRPLYDNDHDAGLTHGGFYHQFGSQDELATEACAHVLSEQAAGWRGQPEEGYTWHMKKTFSDKVRDIVRKIPKGKTMTYKEVASKAGNPKAARAVGAVMRSNYDPSIPCHRVVASDGKMRGYNRGARIR